MIRNNRSEFKQAGKKLGKFAEKFMRIVWRWPKPKGKSDFHPRGSTLERGWSQGDKAPGPEKNPRKGAYRANPGGVRGGGQGRGRGRPIETKGGG